MLMPMAVVDPTPTLVPPMDPTPSPCPHSPCRRAAPRSVAAHPRWKWQVATQTPRRL